jgi:hypothetical protein
MASATNYPAAPAWRCCKCHKEVGYYEAILPSDCLHFWRPIHSNSNTKLSYDGGNYHYYYWDALKK